METNDTTQQVCELERIYLDRLEAENQQVSAYLSQCLRQFTPEEITGVINYLQSWVQYLHTYEPLAQSLAASGCPQLSHRVSQITNDLQGAIGIYSQMYQSAVRFRYQTFQIQTAANQECTRILMEANAHTQQVFNRSTEMYNLVVNRDYPMWAADLITKLGR